MELYYNNCITVTVEFYNRLYNGRGDENKKGITQPKGGGLGTREMGGGLTLLFSCIPYKTRKV